MSDIIKLIEQKKDIELLVNHVINNPNEVDSLVDVIKTNPKSIKFGCEKILRLVSEKEPELIYPYFDFFVQLIDSPNSFLKWGAIMTVANLVKIDTQNKFEEIFERYFRLINEPAMVTAANTIGHSWKIALAKPYLTDTIVERILKLENTSYIHKGEVSPECKNIVRGVAIQTFGKIIPLTNKKEEIIGFVEKQLNNKRPKVRKQAEAFMRKIDRGRINKRYTTGS